MKKLAIIFLGIFLVSCAKLKLEQGARFPNYWKNKKFVAREGQRAMVEAVKHPIYGDHITLYLLNEKDSISTSVRFDLKGVPEGTTHYSYQDNGRTQIIVSHQPYYQFNSISYAKRDTLGYVVEGAQIEIVEGRLSDEIGSKYYIQYSDEHKKEVAKYWRFTSKKDSVMHYAYTSIKNEAGAYIGGSSTQYDELGKVIDVDSTTLKSLKVEMDDKHKKFKRTLESMEGELFVTTQEWTYNDAGQVKDYLFRDSLDRSKVKWLSYDYDNKGRLLSEEEYHEKDLYSKKSLRYGTIKAFTENPTVALKNIVFD